MDKTAIKNFSIWARNKLIADITYKAGLLGITEEGIKDALPQSTQNAEFYDIGTKEPYAIHGEEMKQRKELVSVIQKKASQLEYKDAYRNVIEEVAYTWFNRLIAIRFMEVNDYMPAHIRVLSSESIPSKDGWTKLEPDLVTTPFDAEIKFTQQETEHIMQMKNDNQVDALFRFLFIKQCNALNAYLPKLFEKTSDYTELLLNVSVTDQDGIVYHLTHDIKEDDFNISNIGEDGKPTGQVEIIGWMYQYYNTEPKDETFALLKKNVKITKERIPAATQLFTPDWIVRYMVENSVGRLWLEGHENEILKKGWKYYLDEAEQEAEVEEQLKAIREEYKNIKPEEIKVIDPCMGSGHILVYAFDVLMQIYESYGYSQRDAAKSIVENNIYGLDIDDRAFQLAYFAIMMKARSYNRRFLTLGIEPNLCAIQESNGIQYDKDMGEFLLSEEHRETLRYLLHTFVDAKEYGSILNVEKRDYDGFLKAWELSAEATLESVVMIAWYNECNQIVPTLAKQAKILSEKYESVVTNPPYMGSSGMNNKLQIYTKQFFPDSKLDMFAVYIERCNTFCAGNAYQAMITQQSWMFLTSFDRLREKILQNTIICMAHQGARGFEEISGEVVQTVAFIIRKCNLEGYISNNARLVNYPSQFEKEKGYLRHENEYIVSNSRYKTIPGNPIIYWVSSKAIQSFNEDLLENHVEIKQGAATSDNNRFLRIWYEVDKQKIGFDLKRKDAIESEYKWFPYNKGGTAIRWYGNNDYIVNYGRDGKEMKVFHEELNKTHPGGRLKNQEYYFREGFTWSALSNIFAVRYCPTGFIFDTKGSMGFAENGDELYFYMGLLNSVVGRFWLSLLAPTLDFNPISLRHIPVKIGIQDRNEVIENVKKCISISKEIWDSKEISWNFTKNPVAKRQDHTVEDAVKQTLDYYNKTLADIGIIEKEIDTIFIEAYDLVEEIADYDDSRNKILSVYTEKDVIEQLISFAVGCMFGRYDIDKEGTIFAGGKWDNSVYNAYIPDKDNIIPITDEEYFGDDIVGRFVDIISLIYGKTCLEKNIEYIANILDCKGNSAREKIRYYFINDFYNAHCSMYTVTGAGKRPIYWLFDSGKQNGFKALIYMHRYNADTIGNLRVDYLHRTERIYESEINRMQDMIDNSNNAREVTIASKRKEKLQKQLKECQEYDEKIGHLALSRIEIDLDDGVKVNYEKVQTAKDGKKYQVLAKV